MPYILTLPANEIPNDSIVTKVKGTYRYRLVKGGIKAYTENHRQVVFDESIVLMPASTDQSSSLQVISESKLLSMHFDTLDDFEDLIAYLKAD